MPVVINTTMGQLTLDFERVELVLDTGSTITFQALDKAAEAYWNEWEQKAEKGLLGGSMEHWPFDQPPNCAVITVRQIIEEGAPIQHVTHDSDDHGWQFLTFADAQEQDAMIVSFGEVVELDPTLLKLADLPPGWHAWRQSIGSEWIREPNPNDEIEDARGDT